MNCGYECDVPLFTSQVHCTSTFQFTHQDLHTPHLFSFSSMNYRLGFSSAWKMQFNYYTLPKFELCGVVEMAWKNATVLNQILNFRVTCMYDI